LGWYLTVLSSSIGCFGDVSKDSDDEQQNKKELFFLMRKEKEVRECRKKV